MGKENKIYWKGLEQLKNDSPRIKSEKEEFADVAVDNDSGHSRRDFLKMMGFSVATASIAACQAPIRKVIPYVNKPVDVDPGIANYYASTYINGGDYCSIVVKTREGRPIKIGGNPSSKISMGGTSAQVEASVLSLYDNYRLRGPKIGNTKSEWETLDNEVIQKLDQISKAQNKIYIVSNTVLSPSTQEALGQFMEKYPTAQHIQYDPVSYYGIQKANELSFGKASIPSYDFSKAKVIVSMSADFLGTWLSPIEFSKQYSVNRKIDENRREMSRHYQFEATLSLTGANADYRTTVKPSDEGLVIIKLHDLIAEKVGKPLLGSDIADIAHLSKAATDLWSNKGKSLIISGSNDKNIQLVVNRINSMLGNYGSTIMFSSSVNYRKGNDEEMINFVNGLSNGETGGVIFYNCNPVYNHPLGDKLSKALKNIPLTVSTGYTEDETSSSVVYKAPDHHYLESWNDFEPKSSSYSLSQPAITPLFNSRQGQESFLIWSQVNSTDYYTFIRDNWNRWFYTQERGLSIDFDTWWEQKLYEGVYDKLSTTSELTFNGDVSRAGKDIKRTYDSKSKGLELVLFESYSLGDGSQANNPLLQELPDPISKVVWDQPILISQRDATRLGFSNDSESNTQVGALSAGGITVEAPILIQPGQAVGTLGFSLGYGRTKVGKVAENIGVNAFRLLKIFGGSIHGNIISGVTLTKLDKPFQLAQTQTHQTYMGRENIIQESVLSEFIKNPSAGRNSPKVTNWDEKVEPSTLSLWKGHEYKDHHWGMAIDLNTCNGCGACIVSCNVENNVAIVGKDEVIRRREMHWLRIDRYYSSDGTDGDNKSMENASENPEVVFQPMMCQHCNNAPCETVCPVAATTHSTEGLNQMTYNRCIGTRYCANNCPYKVRRFNWFKYHDNQQFYQSNPSMNTDLGRMVLNPDVTVRSRGVMEKCSFCVQRIQEGKLTAKREKRTMRDRDVVSACQAACTSGAISFGDMNDSKSDISKLLKIEKNKERPYGIDKKIGNPRAYRMLEDIGVKPNVFYLTKIRNKYESQESS